MATAAKPPTKSEVLNGIAKATDLTRKQVASVFDALGGMAKSALGRRGPGVFVIPGMVKMTVVQKPAVPERKGISPFTKQEQIFKAKPARKVVKVRPLKKLKQMV